jgi:hypothetical protein
MRPAALLTHVGDGGEQLAGLAGLTTTRRSTSSETLGGFQLSRSSGLDGISSSSTAYRITLTNTDRLRAIVVALAARPS